MVSVKYPPYTNENVHRCNACSQPLGGTAIVDLTCDGDPHDTLLHARCAESIGLPVCSRCGGVDEHVPWSDAAYVCLACWEDEVDEARARLHERAL